MESISGLQIVTYLFCAGIIMAFAMQLGRYAKMPTHLRWELYPLAGERNRPWGGSYLEESEWWTKPPEEKNLLGEAKFIGEEVLFFKEYYHLNRKFWYFVYPFHIGIFLFAGFVVLLLVGALTMVGDMAVSAGSTSAWGSLVYYLTIIAGSAGLILGSLGCVGLFIRRMVDKNLAPYTKRIDYINLIFVMAVFLTGLSSWAFADFTFATAREYMKGLITFNSVGGIETIISTHIVLLLLILLYMPFTNMMHFFAKSFAYHSVRWDDGPNLRGSKLEKRLGPLLNQPVSWSAPHIEAITRWSDAVSGTVEEHVPRFQEKEE